MKRLAQKQKKARVGNWSQSFVRFFRDEAGQTTTEYVLILAIVLVVISQVRRSLTKTLGTAMDGVDSKMNEIINSQ